MGIINPYAKLFTSYTPTRPRPGSIGIASQSGNFGGQFMREAEKDDIGVRLFCGSGNEAMITIEDYLGAFEVDDLTGTVVLYIESLKNGHRFLQLADRVSRKKPIIMLKGGKTEAGNSAAASHTGALASNIRVFDAACRQVRDHCRAPYPGAAGLCGCFFLPSPAQGQPCRPGHKRRRMGCCHD